VSWKIAKKGGAALKTPVTLAASLAGIVGSLLELRLLNKIRATDLAMGPCRFCKRNGVQFVNAHIIARSFFTLVRGEGNYSVEMIAGRGSLETPYHQAGVADRAILCEECEPKFGEWDTYGFNVFSVPRGEADAIRHSSDGTPLAIPLEDLNYDILVLFFLSVLWRASVSKLKFFNAVALGPYEDQIRDLLWKREVPPPGKFAVNLGTSLNQRYPNVILAPERCRLEGVLFNRLFLPNVFIHVKTDRRDAPEITQVGILQPRKTNYILCYPHNRTPYPGFFDGIRREIGRARTVNARPRSLPSRE
jgi:hypothetical protein